MKCPNCGGECERDVVDVGVGEIPNGPWGCPDCQWVDREPPAVTFDDALGAVCDAREVERDAMRLK